MIGVLVVVVIFLLLVFGVTFMIVGLIKVNKNNSVKKSDIAFLISGSVLTTIFIIIIAGFALVILLGINFKKIEKQYTQQASVELQVAQKTHNLSDANKAIADVEKGLISHNNSDEITKDIQLIQKADLIKEKLTTNQQK